MPIRLDQLSGDEAAPSPAAPAPTPPVPPLVPGALPPEIEAMILSAQGTPSTVRSVSPRGVTVAPGQSPQQAQAGMRMDLMKKQAGNKLDEASTTRRALRKKAADQKLQLQQAITLFDKIFTEADEQLPVIQNPKGTLPAHKLGRWAGRELGYRETQRGAIESFRARATPALKALGEVGVLTDQDIERILQGGFPSDNDSSTTRAVKRSGLLSDFQTKLDLVNQTLDGDERAKMGATSSGLRYTVED